MCTFVILRRPDSSWPVLIAANRDEMVGRPWSPPARHWPDRPEVVAGKDELAGGSWLGINDHGVVAGILNRFGSLGPAPGVRSRGELVLEALDHADAAAAAAALVRLDPNSYRTFNLVIADHRDAFWLRHGDEKGVKPVAAKPIKDGWSLLSAGELDDATPRLVRYRPRFAQAAIPDPARGDWRAWEELAADDRPDPQSDPQSAMRFRLASGFATVSSALIGLPKAGSRERPRLRFAAWLPEPSPWRDIPLWGITRPAGSAS